MSRDLSMLTLNEFTREMGSLMLKRRSATGLSTAESARLREMKLALRPHAGPAGSPEERRQFLRLEVAADVHLSCATPDDSVVRARCIEFGIGGLFAEMWPPLPVDERMWVRCLTTESDSVPLDVFAVAVRRDEYSYDDGRKSQAGAALRFIDLDPSALDRIRRAFEQLFDQAARSPGFATQLNGRAAAITDVQQLARVCEKLVRYAGINEVWNRHGPSDQLRTLLASNGRPLPVSKRVLLLLAWRLWTGVCDVRSTEFWHLESEAQSAVAELINATRQGLKEVISWIDTHEPPAYNTVDAVFDCGVSRCP